MCIVLEHLVSQQADHIQGVELLPRYSSKMCFKEEQESLKDPPLFK